MTTKKTIKAKKAEVEPTVEKSTSGFSISQLLVHTVISVIVVLVMTNSISVKVDKVNTDVTSFNQAITKNTESIENLVTNDKIIEQVINGEYKVDISKDK